MSGAIAIVGMAGVFPDAPNIHLLWENLLAQRRAFRRIPAQRLSADYLSTAEHALDSSYCDQAALIEGYAFDRLKYRVSGEAFRCTDLAHWLALDVATQALDDAGFALGAGLPRETTGVICGNTLTGELSRANLLRLRWPYVKEVMHAQLVAAGSELSGSADFFGDLEKDFKAAFPAMGEESLAGSLSNTIAGRICNQYDLGGGGFVVDGACSSSLLAVSSACRALAARELDVALAGGVDVSLDPFELVGFSRLGALARDEMRIYDQHPTGFLPGEGCGFAVLMREADARAAGHRIYALIKGWGVSSDGGGGLTRPEASGQARALHRAYAMAQFSVGSVSMFEGHGTGTAVGDVAELTALIHARSGAQGLPTPASIGSIKANIGHTKAAAGIAGLIKAAIALNQQVRPPSTGIQRRHTLVDDPRGRLLALEQAEGWPSTAALRAGVSSFGFGGINVHVALEGETTRLRQSAPSATERMLSASAQDAELFLFASSSREHLVSELRSVLTSVESLSQAQLADLAAHLADRVRDNTVRAAVIASTRQELINKLGALCASLERSSNCTIDFDQGIFAFDGLHAPRVMFLFPGQGSPCRANTGALGRRFGEVESHYRQAIGEWDAEKSQRTEFAQPAIIAAEIAGTKLLRACGIRPSLTVGHSLGELAALSAAEAIGEEELLRLAHARGDAMGTHSDNDGAMASVAADSDQVQTMLEGVQHLTIAAFNGPSQTVISGEHRAVESFVTAAQARGTQATRLPVSDAFHSSRMAEAKRVFENRLREFSLHAPQCAVFSTVTGTSLSEHEDLHALLGRQLIEPVRFFEAYRHAAAQADFAVEVGPGSILSAIARTCSDLPVTSLDIGGNSLKGWLATCGAFFALGGSLRLERLFKDRLSRPLNLESPPSLFANPCSLPRSAAPNAPRAEERVLSNGASRASSVPMSVESELKMAIAAKAEIPAELLTSEMRLLADLHLNSITVAQIVADVARRIGMQVPIAPTEFALATIGQICAALNELKVAEATGVAPRTTPAGLESWVRAFKVRWQPRTLSYHGTQASGKGHWELIGFEGIDVAQRLREALADVAGRGLVMHVPSGADCAVISRLMLQAAESSILRSGERCTWIIAHDGGGSAAFARTLCLERDWVTTRVIDAPCDRLIVDRILAEVSVGSRFQEARFDVHGRRYEPYLEHVILEEGASQVALGPRDVFVISGGGKGIGAECGLALAERFGIRLILLGRSQPETDDELARNLGRLRSKAITFEYVSVDVLDTNALHARLHPLIEKFGPVTGILHAAGTNRPIAISELTETSAREAWSPKVTGLQTLLRVIPSASLRLLVSFGSIIRRTGLPGEAHYALANEQLEILTSSYGKGHPECRCLTIEWSLWSEVGMGQRLGSVETLARQGISAIAPDQGVRAFLELISSDCDGAIVLSSRIPELPTLQFVQPDPPMMRFLERPLIHVPGVELVAEASVSAATDPYLDDHVVSGEVLFPAVLGLEAMAQSAHALVPDATQIHFEDVEFRRPITANARESLRLRSLALADSRGATVRTALQSSATEFLAEHFLATRRVGGWSQAACLREADVQFIRESAIESTTELYEGLLFHRGRFQRVTRIMHLSARACQFQVQCKSTENWFGPFLPSTLLLGDPGARDAALHGIQCCVPHQRLVPIGARKIYPGTLKSSGVITVTAVERSHQDNVYVYDLEARSDDGTLCEAWHGLTLRAIEPIHYAQWQVPLYSVYLQRRLEEHFRDCTLSVRVEEKPGPRAHASQAAIDALLGEHVPILRRVDGKPELVSHASAVSTSHACNVVLAIASDHTVACDAQVVEPRTQEVWHDLLGFSDIALAKLIAQEMHESFDTASTRVWSARECLVKYGLPHRAPLRIRSAADQWLTLASGARSIVSHVATFHHNDGPLVFAVMGGGHDASV